MRPPRSIVVAGVAGIVILAAGVFPAGQALFGSRAPATVRITPSFGSGAAERTVVNLPPEVALFWVQWIERAEHDLSARNQSFRGALATSGPVLCNDVDLGQPPAGRVPACVPFANRAEARFVPAPSQACQP